MVSRLFQLHSNFNIFNVFTVPSGPSGCKCMYVYIVIVMLNMSLDGCNAPESLFISQLWHASLSDERDGRLGGYCPTDIVSGGNARGSQQKNFFFLLQKFKAK